VDKSRFLTIDIKILWEYIGIMALIKYTKKDFLDYASGFDYWSNKGEAMKKWKIKEFRDFYNFTHKDKQTGEEFKAIEGVHCLNCMSKLTLDFRNQFNTNYCADC